MEGGGRALDITITGSPTDAEVAAVLATLARAPETTETTGRAALRYGAGASLPRRRRARLTSAGYRSPRTWDPRG